MTLPFKKRPKQAGLNRPFSPVIASGRADPARSGPTERAENAFSRASTKHDHHESKTHFRTAHQCMSAAEGGWINEREDPPTPFPILFRPQSRGVIISYVVACCMILIDILYILAARFLNKYCGVWETTHTVRHTPRNPREA